MVFNQDAEGRFSAIAASFNTLKKNKFAVPHSSLDDKTPYEFYFENLPELPKAA